ncbi:hypothetical protein H6F67_12015 [Microcoleus sp. FACHB-1515]|uniref:hypothetical protein n=1 Tax=Cyanophyceae TaxID=3028117 RepID=UPI0016824D80|nr:hypothetical protein [Microcoleus sp. FACHB-1515]MBD2090580.1 hypothetical protein [Microcoleus sp. FACHB-1515]
MSQEVSTNPSVLNEIDESASSRIADPIDLLGDGSFPMDSYANRLMDELFGEVDRLFEGGSLPVEAPAPEEVVSLQPIAIPHLEVPDLPPAALAPIESESQIATPDAEAIATLEPAEQSGVNRWLLAAAFASAIAAGVSWLVFFRSAAPPAELSQTAQPSQADQQFANYVQRSLDRIAGRAQTDAPTVAAASSPALPSVAVPSSVPNAAPSAPDRVYIPVYQPPQTLYPPVGVAPVPVVPPAAPSVAVAPAAPAVQPAPAPAAPRPATAAPRPATVPAPAASVAAAPAPQQTLMGLMQFGDRSAALFEVNGSPQRISVGENIGTSGWTLVSVSNDAAVIRRNGEVRSIYVGQQF